MGQGDLLTKVRSDKERRVVSGCEEGRCGICSPSPYGIKAICSPRPRININRSLRVGCGRLTIKTNREWAWRYIEPVYGFFASDRQIFPTRGEMPDDFSNRVFHGLYIKLSLTWTLFIKSKLFSFTPFLWEFTVIVVLSLIGWMSGRL